MTSSKSSNVSGAGCRSDTSIVASITCTIWCKQFTIWNVVELSRPVEISSMKKAFAGPTSISPAHEILLDQKITCSNTVKLFYRLKPSSYTRKIKAISTTSFRRKYSIGKFMMQTLKPLCMSYFATLCCPAPFVSSSLVLPPFLTCLYAHPPPSSLLLLISYPSPLFFAALPALWYDYALKCSV